MEDMAMGALSFVRVVVGGGEESEKRRKGLGPLHIPENIAFLTVF
jgi:hypothetical protein